MEVTSPEKSDYLLIFCPVNSQVGADIAEALDTIPRKKCLFTLVFNCHQNDREPIQNNYMKVF